MLKCSEVSRLIASDECVDAPWTRRLAIRLHLMMCKNCSRYASQLRAIGKAVRAIRHSQGHTDLQACRRLETSILKRTGQTAERSDSPESGNDH